MVSIVADGLATLTIAVASIPLMQKLAFVAAFWIISIFISVVTLHPIILSFVRPPHHEIQPNRWSDRMYNAITDGLIALGAAAGAGRWSAASPSSWPSGSTSRHQLKTGDTAPGVALLYPDHPYNVAFRKVNEKFVGASQLVIIAEGKKARRSRTPRRSTSSTSSSATWSRGRRRRLGDRDDAAEEDLPHLPRGRPEVGDAADAATTTSGSSSSCSPSAPPRRDGPLLQPDYTNATITIFYGLQPRRSSRAPSSAPRSTSPHTREARRQRALPSRRRPVRHPRGRERGGRVVVPGQRAADLLRRLPAQLTRPTGRSSAR